MKYPVDAPIACSLTDLGEREKEWTAVMTSGLRARRATPTGVRLEFAPDLPTGHALLDLIGAERECCAWARWTLTSTPEATLVEATAEGEGPSVLQAMFTVTP